MVAVNVYRLGAFPVLTHEPHISSTTGSDHVYVVNVDPVKGKWPPRFTDRNKYSPLLRSNTKILTVTGLSLSASNRLVDRRLQNRIGRRSTMCQDD
jgi:hypothetical protein